MERKGGRSKDGEERGRSDLGKTPDCRASFSFQERRSTVLFSLFVSSYSIFLHFLYFRNFFFPFLFFVRILPFVSVPFFFFFRSTDAKTIFILQSNFCFLSPQLNQFSIPPVLLFSFFLLRNERKI